MQMPRFVRRRATIASPSIISVLPASTDSAVAPAARIACDRRHADDRHVEPHVLVRLGDLDDADAGAGELAGARDHRVGAFHRLDGDDGRRLDGNRLADVEAGDGVGHPVAELEVAAARPRSARARSARPSRASSGARNAVESISSMPWSRSTSATPEMSRVGVPRLAAASARQQRQVGHDAGEHLRVLHLAGHHRLGDARPPSAALMHVPSWPSEIQWTARGRPGARRRSRARERPLP